MPTTDRSLLEAALVGYAAEREKITQKIAEIQAQLGGRRGRLSVPVAAGPVKRTRKPMSAAARKRIAEAQKRRWKAYRKERA